ncbi:hypothetical protein LA080_006527 [Diaporthe eres]|nr:hypothetical protein LA080_006527 [Diaporthe eres]
MRQQDGVVDDSFAGVCRSPGFVKAFWADPLLQLTAAHLKVGPDYLQSQMFLDGEDLARQATVAWDGLKPPTLQAAINNITRAEHDGQGNTTYIFFKSLALLQVDLTPAQGSTHSLVDIWRFTADKWTIVPVRSGVGTGTPAGKEEVPMNRRTPTRWPFELDDAIPAGCKLTLFYTSFSEPTNMPLSIEPAATVETDDEPLDIYMSDYKERSLEAWRYASNRSRPSPSSRPPNGTRPGGAMKRKTAEDREMGHDGLKRQKLPDRGALMATSVTRACAHPPPPHTESEPHTTNALRTGPAIRVECVPAQPIPHERRSNAPPTNLQPPTARPADRVPIPLPPPSGLRADRGVKRGMNSDGEVGNDDHKRPKLTDSDALPRGAAMAPTSLTRAVLRTSIIGHFSCTPATPTPILGLSSALLLKLAGTGIG